VDTLLEGSAQDLAAKLGSVMAEQAFQSDGLRLDRPATVVLFPAITLLLVAAALTGRSLNAPIALALLAGGVVCLGLPHGSLDLLVARHLFNRDRRFTTARFLLAYALIAAICASVWLAFPSISLTIFLLISALHFASDWQQRGWLLGRVAYGACIVTVPVLHHAEVVRQIYVQLGATGASEIVRASGIIALLAAPVALVSLLSHIRLRLRDIVELGVILVSAWVLPPLVFFLCYFCFLHSPRHLMKTAHEVGLRSPVQILAAVLPMVAATLVLAAILWRFLPANQSSSRILEIIFIGLAALTVPHMLLTRMRELDESSGSHTVVLR
jgi:Brp/Blh family beta-carotene 15,15'-monooxygenase